MSRGRPRGSMKPDRRQRRDYRFSPATLQKIAQGREITGKTETAFVEAAVCHYLDFLTREEADTGEMERLRARVQDLERELAEASRPSHPRPVPSVERQQPAVAATPTLPTRRPTYQIYMRHEPGACPDLPESFDYIDQDRSKGNQRCMNPIHRVFAQPCPMASTRKQAERLKEVAGIMRIWIEDAKGQPLSRDSWRRENGRWIRDD